MQPKKKKGYCMSLAETQCLYHTCIKKEMSIKRQHTEKPKDEYKAAPCQSGFHYFSQSFH